MLRYAITIFLLVVFCSVSAKTYSEDHEITFSPNKFEYYIDDFNLFHIDAQGQTVVYSEENVPELPLFPIDIVISGGRKYVSSNSMYKKYTLFQDKIIPNHPEPIATDGSNSKTPPPLIDYAPDVYPKDNCQYVGSSEWDDVVILHFMACPYIYDSTTGTLSFTEKINLHIETEDSEKDATANLNNFSFNKSVLKSLAFNHKTADTIIIRGPLTRFPFERIDYVIVTSKELYDTFMPLIQWKKTKGVRSKIITMEYIEANYPGETIQLKLKNCLYDYYKRHGIKYVMLGGDDTVVPVLYCLDYPQNRHKNNYKNYIYPSDLFYACFGGQFDWDGNANEIYGEKEDGISLAPSIHLTRLPVRSKDDISGYVAKVLSYERAPKWSNKKLLCATNIFDYKDVAADMEKYYQSKLAPYWKEDTYRFYDTYQTIQSTDYPLTPHNMVEQFSNGYSFISLLTHGGYKIWQSNDKLITFSTDDVSKIYNCGHTILTTMACYTNGFENANDPCLSESFIRNQNSGILAYYGCSRSNYLPCGQDYEGAFYKYLYDKSIPNNYGFVVSTSKISQLGSIRLGSSYYNAFLSMNPIGDPEMPIFSEEPKEFERVNFSNLAGYGLDLDTGVDSCRVCLMSMDDFGASFYEIYEDVRNLSISDLPVKCNICITKDGYIPRQYTVCNIQNESIEDSQTFEYDIIKAGVMVTGKKDPGFVQFLSGSTILSGDIILFDSDVFVSEDAELILK